MGLKSFVKTLVVGAGAGAAVVWLADPERGQQRRERLVEKAGSTLGEAKGVLQQTKGQVERATDEIQDRADGGEGRDRHVELTQGTPAQTSTPQSPDDLIVPGQPTIP